MLSKVADSGRKDTRLQLGNHLFHGAVIRLFPTVRGFF
jgi:hypothetical protein